MNSSNIFKKLCFKTKIFKVSKKFLLQPQLVSALGVSQYRFSLSWSRLVPTGDVRDGVNTKAIAYYTRLIENLVARGVSPTVTLYHFDLPQQIQDNGGRNLC